MTRDAHPLGSAQPEPPVIRPVIRPSHTQSSDEGTGTLKRPLSLSAYLVLERRKPQAPAPDAPPRPGAELVWLHASDPTRRPAALALMSRLKAQRPGLRLLLTTEENAAPPISLPEGTIWQPAPPENLPATAEFIRHWRPDLCLWSHGELRPALLIEADEAGVPLVLIDGAEEGFDAPVWNWMPDLSRNVLARFAAIHAQSANAARRLRRLGAREADIEISGPIQEGTPALGCNESDREALTDTLTGRPVWLASRIRPQETAAVIDAHRAALRHAHRLLMILVPENEAAADAAAQALVAAGLNTVRWSEGGWPEESTQVLLADTRDELGLWYRIAPVCFLGGSLLPGHGGVNPYEASALGSAVLYGPHVGRHLPAYSRLAAAGAARIVKDGPGLAAALIRVIAPDQAATMAHAAWKLATEGAEVTDAIIDLVQDQLDLHPGPPVRA